MPFNHKPQIIALSTIMLLPVLNGCMWGQKAREENPDVRVTQEFSYTGEPVFRGTIQSMCRMVNAEPQLVSGYGLVVGLNGTGSSEVPTWLREKFESKLQVMGFGSRRTGFLASPEQVLADMNTTIVAIEGYIPPGASQSSRFDVIVRAIDSQTTSLAGGRLYIFDLAEDGLEASMRSRIALAAAAGEVYVDPTDDALFASEDSTELSANQFRRTGVILDGGVVTHDRRVHLVLNQVNHTLSDAIRNAINQAFPSAPGESPTAYAASGQRVEIRVPAAWRGNSSEFLQLINNLYVSRSDTGFITEQSHFLINQFSEEVAAQRLEQEQLDIYEERMSYALRAFGTGALAVLRQYYNTSDEAAKALAIRAGAALGDSGALEVIIGRAENHSDLVIRQMAIEDLKYGYRNLSVHNCLQRLINSDIEEVRIEAWRTSLIVNQQLRNLPRPTSLNFVDSMPVVDQLGRIKFWIDRVESENRSIHVGLDGLPRLAIFGSQETLPAGSNIRLCDGVVLTIESRELDMENFVLPEARELAEQAGISLEEALDTIPRTVEVAKLWRWSQERQMGVELLMQPEMATLLFTLGHYPTMQTQEGLDMSFNEVLRVLVLLEREQVFDMPLTYDTNPLIELIEQQQRRIERPNARPIGDPDSEWLPDYDASEDILEPGRLPKNNEPINSDNPFARP